MIIHPDMYARHDVIIESACLWLEDVNAIRIMIQALYFLWCHAANDPSCTSGKGSRALWT